VSRLLNDDLAGHSRMHGADKVEGADRGERARDGGVHHDGNVWGHAGDVRVEDGVVPVVIRAAGDVKPHDAAAADDGGEREVHVAGGVDVDGLDLGRSRGLVVITGGKRGYKRKGKQRGSHVFGGGPGYPSDDNRAAALRAFYRLCASCVTAMVMACGSDPAAPAAPEEPVYTAADTAAGNFSLSAVGTASIPATILSETGYTMQAGPSTALLADGGQLTIAINTIETVAGYASTYADTLTGTWTQVGTDVRFHIPPGAAGVNVGWDGTRLAVGLIVATAEGSYVFTKDR